MKPIKSNEELIIDKILNRCACVAGIFIAAIILATTIIYFGGIIQEIFK